MYIVIRGVHIVGLHRCAHLTKFQKHLDVLIQSCTMLEFDEWEYISGYDHFLYSSKKTKSGLMWYHPAPGMNI